MANSVTNKRVKQATVITYHHKNHRQKTEFYWESFALAELYYVSSVHLLAKAENGVDLGDLNAKGHLPAPGFMFHYRLCLAVLKIVGRVVKKEKKK
jgi:hypothetical protein